MDMIRTFFEQQPLLLMFLVIGFGYALGAIPRLTKNTAPDYVITFPTGTIMKILLLQVMLTMMG